MAEVDSWSSSGEGEGHGGEAPNAQGSERRKRAVARNSPGQQTPSAGGGRYDAPASCRMRGKRHAGDCSANETPVKKSRRLSVPGTNATGGNSPLIIIEDQTEVLPFDAAVEAAVGDAPATSEHKCPVPPIDFLVDKFEKELHSLYNCFEKRIKELEADNERLLVQLKAMEGIAKLNWAILKKLRGVLRNLDVAHDDGEESGPDGHA